MSEYHTVRGKTVYWHGASAATGDDGGAHLTVGAYTLDGLAEADVVALYQVLGDVVEWGDPPGGTEGAIERRLNTEDHPHDQP